jgi:hypothetical protein
MPKQTKQRKKLDSEDFDDMLADFRAADLTTDRSTTGISTTLSSSSILGTDATRARRVVRRPALGVNSRKGVGDRVVQRQIGLPNSTFHLLYLIPRVFRNL